MNWLIITLLVFLGLNLAYFKLSKQAFFKGYNAGYDEALKDHK